MKVSSLINIILWLFLFISSHIALLNHPIVDIYKIQERKARMNEAIMEEGSNKRKKNSSDNKEICRLANAAVERFLQSPTKTKDSVINID